MVAHHLKPEEAKGNQESPAEKEQADQPEALALERHGARRGIGDGVNGGLHGYRSGDRS
jgi:hypothetical protein